LFSGTVYTTGIRVLWEAPGEPNSARDHRGEPRHERRGRRARACSETGTVGEILDLSRAYVGRPCQEQNRPAGSYSFAPSPAGTRRARSWRVELSAAVGDLVFAGRSLPITSGAPVSPKKLSVVAAGPPALSRMNCVT